MAQVARDLHLQARIDDYLDYLLRQWEGVPALAAEWAEWDEHSQLVFALDWPICEDRLHQLDEWADQGAMTRRQRTRHQELLKLVAQHRPLLEEMLKEDAA